VPNSVVCYFAMFHGSYDSNLDSKRLILVIVIRSRSWPNIDGTYAIFVIFVSKQSLIILQLFLLKNQINSENFKYCKDRKENDSVEN
jgi:hypothetical protein